MEPIKKPVEHLYLSSKSIGIDFFKAYQQQNVEKMLSLCDDQCEISFIPLGESGQGLVHIVGKSIWEMLIDSFPSINNSVEKVSSDGRNITCEVMIRGRQAKDFAGITSKGNEFEQPHIFIFQLNNQGLVNNISVNWDHEAFVRQLTI